MRLTAIQSASRGGSGLTAFDETKPIDHASPSARRSGVGRRDPTKRSVKARVGTRE